MATRPDLLPAQRRARLLDLVRERGSASIHELAEDLQTSLSTIRRDLDQLTEAGYLERTHGGVLLRRVEPATFETESALNAQLALKQKQAIGLVAAQRFETGISVLCDSSTTVLEAMRIVVERKLRLTVVTNSLPIATLCAPSSNIRVVVPGGTVRAGTGTLFGAPGELFLESIHADLCLLGTHSITGTVLTEASVEGAVAKQTMIRCSRRTVLLADSSKFRLPSFCTIGEITQLDEIITDDGVAPRHLQPFEGSALKVTVVTCRTGSEPHRVR
ncbi:DeoR/GlpR family DNA-binding transcription regulator [Lichenicoccus sp.]|uniref:DeoR/GlpR family DNA-binding transcription regulator n=1 Tax=Lichenicoccus sp. TaxID=2781899 RepID=UPI003D0AE235